VAADAYHAKRHRDKLRSRLEEITPETPKRHRAWEGPKPLVPDQYAVRGIRRNCIVAAVLFVGAVVVGLSQSLSIPAVSIPSLIWLGLGVGQYFIDKRDDKDRMNEYEHVREQYEALVEGHRADVAEYQERRRNELPTIEVELAVAEREYQALKQQVVEHDRRQRTATRLANGLGVPPVPGAPRE